MLLKKELLASKETEFEIALGYIEFAVICGCEFVQDSLKAQRNDLKKRNKRKI